MHRSKLEFYEDIINVLAEHALTVDGIAFQCSTSCITLLARLDFLTANNIVAIEFSRDNRAFYVLTSRGVAISKTLAITKRLEKLQNRKVSSMVLEAVPVLFDEEEEKIGRD